MLTLTIAIPTFNRKQIVKFCAQSISNIDNLENIQIVILDDCSSEYDLNFLKSIFPAHASVHRNLSNSGGADINARKLLDLSLTKKTDLILMLDSDMIISSDIVMKINQYVGVTDGFLSIFNTDSHQPKLDFNNFVIKDSVGCAGSLMTFKIAEMILQNVSAGDSFDFRFCQFLTCNNIKIFCLKQSLVQHLGFLDGQNSSGINGDIGNMFFDKDIKNLYILNEFVLREIQNQRKYVLKNFLKKNRLFNKISILLKSALERSK